MSPIPGNVLRILLLLLAILYSTGLATTTPAHDSCLGEYQLCASSNGAGGDCVLDAEQCGSCGPGQYRCPLSTTCVDDAKAYMTCPGVKGSHLDWTLPLETRLDKLVAGASVDDMISQLTNDAPPLLHLGIPSYNWLNDDQHGVKQPHATSFPNGNSLGATWSHETLRAVGAAIGTEARGLHNGFVHEGNRGFLQNGVGISLYAPNLNLVRDPRWGRAQEVFSEDPQLTGSLVKQFVRGAQEGPSDVSTTATTPYWLTAACCKHFAAYDLESIPIDRYFFSAEVDVRNMWETYLPAFYACVVEAEAAHVMCSYNAINGVPACGSKPLLDGILREQWGFQGFVVSDYDAWAQIKDTHAYCPNMTCAASVGLKAGMDQEGGGTAAISALPQALQAGNVTEAHIATAFRRLFRVRMRLGMLDPPTMVPWNYLSNGTSVVESAAHIALAREAARQGVSMYKNSEGTLPLSGFLPGEMGDQKRTIALIGPQMEGTTLLQGNYAKPPDLGVVSVLEGVTAALTGKAVQPNCTMQPGIGYNLDGQSGLTSPNPAHCAKLCTVDPTCGAFTWSFDTCYKGPSATGAHSSDTAVSGVCAGPHPADGQVLFARGCSNIECANTSGFADAVDAARSADVVVVGVGLDQNLESEGHDRAVIELPANQYALVSTIRDALGAKKPLIVLMVHGGTIAMQSLLDDADGVLDAWYPGQEGGNGIADVLFGKYNPAGRASVTYYSQTSDLPPMQTMNLYPTNSSQGLTYRHFRGTPVVPFGFGLSFTSFKYSGLRLNTTAVDGCDVVGLSVDVHNSGKVDGDEVVQVYVKQPGATLPVPQVRLADFARVHIPAGSQRTVALSVSPAFHSVVRDGPDVFNGTVIVETGVFQVFVGGGQPDYFSGHLAASVKVTASHNVRDC